LRPGFPLAAFPKKIKLKLCKDENFASTPEVTKGGDICKMENGGGLKIARSTAAAVDVVVPQYGPP
jgi:hypothetical protein